MVKVATKGRKFEYDIRDLMLKSGYVVAKSTCSRPWDLTAGGEHCVYAIECKSSELSPNQAGKVYRKQLLEKITIERNGEQIISAFVPLLFHNTKTGALALYTRASFRGKDGIIRRPYLDGEKLIEVESLNQEGEN